MTEIRFKITDEEAKQLADRYPTIKPTQVMRMILEEWKRDFLPCNHAKVQVGNVSVSAPVDRLKDAIDIFNGEK